MVISFVLYREFMYVCTYVHTHTCTQLKCKLLRTGMTGVTFCCVWESRYTPYTMYRCLGWIFEGMKKWYWPWKRCVHVCILRRKHSSSNNKIKTKFLLVYAWVCTCRVCMYLAALAITCAFCVLGVYLFDFKFEHNKMKTKWINWMLLVMPVKLIKYKKNWSAWNSLTCTMTSGVGEQVTDLRAIEVVENTYLSMASACKTGENELRVYSQIKLTHARIYVFVWVCKYVRPLWYTIYLYMCFCVCACVYVFCMRVYLWTFSLYINWLLLAAYWHDVGRKSH